MNELDEEVRRQAQEAFQEGCRCSDCFPPLNLGGAHEVKLLWRQVLTEYRKALSKRPDYKPARQRVARMPVHLN